MLFLISSGITAEASYLGMRSAGLHSPPHALITAVPTIARLMSSASRPNGSMPLQAIQRGNSSTVIRSANSRSVQRK